MSIEEVTSKKEVKILLGVYISAVKKIRTKKGETMAFLTVSDEEGDLDAVVFPNSYRNFVAKIQTGTIVMIQGILEERDGKPQVNVQQLYSLAEAKQMANAKAGTLFIKIESERQTKDVLQKIKKNLLQHHGNTKVMLYYERENRYVQLSLWDWVNPNEHLKKRLIEIVGMENVILRKE